MFSIEFFLTADVAVQVQMVNTIKLQVGRRDKREDQNHVATGAAAG